MKLTLLNRLKICFEVMSIRSGHKHTAQEKILTTFYKGYKAGMHDQELELMDRLSRTETTLQKYAKYATRKAMLRDIRLIGCDT